MPPSTHTTLHCPRCAYDVSAEARRWNDDAIDEREGLACPLEGTCPECGLHFSWALLYRPELADVPWFIEFVGKGPSPAKRYRFAAICTWIMAMLPWLFWRHVSLEVPHQPRKRLWWLVVVFILSPIVLVAIYLTWVAAYSYFRVPPVTPFWSVTPPDFVQVELLESIKELWNVTPASLIPPRWMPWVSIFFVGFVLYPFTLFCLPWTRAKSKVSTQHVRRAWVYSAAPMLTAFLLAIIARCIDSALYPFSLYGHSFRENWYDPLRHTTYWPVSLDIARVETLLIPAFSAWQLLFWLFALRSGFRMTDWRRVLLAIAAPSLIAQGFLVLMVPVM
jgi:hypothetical protein